MYGTELPERLSKDNILKKISEYDVFRYYIGEDFKMNSAMSSPLRKDSNPSFTIFISKNNQLRYKDFATEDSGDCFDLVVKKYNVTFRESMEIVDNDFQLGMGSMKSSPTMNTVGVVYKRAPLVHKSAEIRVKRRQWSLSDMIYWNSYGITEAALNEFNVFPVDRVWINGNVVASYHKSNPLYCYHFGGYEYKIYMPMRDKKHGRFYCNTSAVQGWDQLPEVGSKVIVTKSMKDIMVYWEHGIAACAPQSESVILNDRKAFMLDLCFDRVVVNYDFDYRGIVSANKMKRLYKMEPFFLTDGRFGSVDFEAKDVSDLVKNKGANHARKIIYSI